MAQLTSIYQSKISSDLKNSDVEFIFNVIRGIFQTPDIIAEQHVPESIRLMKMASEATMDTLWSLEDDLPRGFL